MKNWTTSFPEPFDILYGKIVRAEKMWNLKKVFSEMFVETLCNKLLLLPKKIILPKKYTTSPNKKIIELKFLSTSFFKIESNSSPDK